MMFACLAALVLTALPAAAHTATDVPAQAQDGAVPDGFTYIVQRGDTLAILAARYHTTVAAIVRANGLTNPNLIYAGQILYIPAPPQPACGATYIVRYGDTLARIARRCGTTVQALAIANNIYNINLIFAGQVLVITTHVPPPPPPPPTLIITYYVQPGDFIARIAARFGTTANAIIAYNRLTHPNLIYPGQILYIPVYS
jgi:LysM repeat protein